MPRGARGGGGQGGTAAAHDGDGRDEEEADEDPGDDARDEHLADALLGHDAVDDEDDAGRDHHADAARGSDGAGGEAGVVLAALHLGEGDGGHGGRGGRSAAADGPEGGAGADGRHREAAAQPAEPGVGRGEEFLGDAGVEGDLPHEDEEGDDGQAVAGEDVVIVGGQDGQRSVRVDDDGEAHQADEGHGEPHRHAQEEQQEQGGDAEKGDLDFTHGRASSWNGRGGAGARG